MPKSDPALEDDTAEDIVENPPESLFNPGPAAEASQQPAVPPNSKIAADMAEAGEPFTPKVPTPSPAAAKAASQNAASPTTNAARAAPTSNSEPETEPETPQMFPPNVLATYLAPMRHKPTHGIPVASLQLRSYSVRNLEFFADFCMRAAFYLKMPASGPVPLPRRTERWTTLRSNFIFKKSQENFERITCKRLITVYDSDKTAVEAWLAFVRKWQFYGVGMKANVWEFESPDVAKNMDKEFDEQISEELNEKLSLFGWNKKAGSDANVPDMLRWQDKLKNGPGSPMSEVTAFDRRNEKFDRNLVEGRPAEGRA
jgi:small subunit ribosomal protein S10